MDFDSFLNAAREQILRRDTREVEKTYRAALQAYPGNARMTYELGVCLVMQGRYEEGWRLIAQTGFHNVWKNTTPVGSNQWRGDSLRGKSILVMTALGYGDRIMMARYFDVLKQSGVTRLGVSGPSRLQALFSAIPAVDAWHTVQGVEAAPWERYDYSTRCMTLPALCGTHSVDKIPANIPYLKAPQNLRADSLDKIDCSGPLRVGLVWAGNPEIEADKRRSLDLKILEPLFSQSAVRFYSLQMDQGRQQIENFRFKDQLVDLMDGVSDFADTAAIVEKLDLVISVDTSVVHLAGALGKPVWMLDRFDHSHLWLLDRLESPWYPGVMRIFRQPSLGDWSSVIGAVSQALELHVKFITCATSARA